MTDPKGDSTFSGYDEKISLLGVRSGEREIRRKINKWNIPYQVRWVRILTSMDSDFT